MVPVTLLGQGKCFGELALEVDEKNPTKVGKRQASIWCTDACQFAIISKEDYNNCLKIIDQRRKEIQMKFFKQNPFLNRLPHSTLSKLNLSLEYVKCHRGQVIISEGRPSTKLIIVAEGEFLVRKTLSNVNKRKRLYNKREDINFMDDLATQRKNLDRTQYQINMTLLGKGQLFGEDDLINDKPYSHTLVCNQMDSAYYQMAKSEFNRIFRSNLDSWKMLRLQAKNKNSSSATKVSEFLSL